MDTLPPNTYTNINSITIICIHHYWCHILIRNSSGCDMLKTPCHRRLTAAVVRWPVHSCCWIICKCPFSFFVLLDTDDGDDLLFLPFPFLLQPTISAIFKFVVVTMLKLLMSKLRRIFSFYDNFWSGSRGWSCTHLHRRTVCCRAAMVGSSLQ